MNEETVKSRIKEFTWYSPVDFGNGVVAGGDFKVETDLGSIHFGVGKWKYIVERNLPDLQGKRVLDIGCNNGTSCVQMARLGAREVVGVDSDATWKGWKPQAEFVKQALEWRCGTTYPITFQDGNMAEIPAMGLGEFDVVTALCCIYYLTDGEILALLKHFGETSRCVLLQCNTRKADQEPEVHRKAVPAYLTEALRAAGFEHVRVDAPWLYERPVVVGSVQPFPPGGRVGKVDRVRRWVRSKV